MPMIWVSRDTLGQAIRIGEELLSDGFSDLQEQVQFIQDLENDPDLDSYLDDLQNREANQVRRGRDQRFPSRGARRRGQVIAYPWRANRDAKPFMEIVPMNMTAASGGATDNKENGFGVFVGLVIVLTGYLVILVVATQIVKWAWCL